MAGEEYQAAIQGIEQALNDSIASFIGWLETEWRGSDKAAWQKAFSEPYPEGHKEGWDACIDSLRGALECFKDEYYYS